MGTAVVEHSGCLHVGPRLVGVAWSMGVWLNILTIPIARVILRSSVDKIVRPVVRERMLY